MTNTKIIGLLGPAGAGKSTAAAYLVEAHGARRYSLAAPLKEIAMRALGFTEAQCYGTQAEKEAVDPRYGFSCRWFLQKLGTEGCRAVLGEDVWADALMRKIAADAPALAVVEDVRFANEARIIRAAGGRVWRLEPAPDGPRASSDDGTHRSEAEWRAAPWDAAIRPARFGVDHLQRLVDLAYQNARSDWHGHARMFTNAGEVADWAPGAVAS